MARARKRRGRSARAAKRTAPATRAERRAALAHRRSVVALVGSLVLAAIISVAWFPAGALIDQHRTLAQSSSALDQLRSQNRALRTESKNLSKPTEIARIARQQFQLIAPGEQAYQVLPAPGKTSGATDPYSGDPGNSSPVSPSAAPELPPGSVGHHHVRTAVKHTTTTVTTPGSAGAPGLATRLVDTLEFWR
ncbi:MAG: FtsB family cell division protein [Acidimicrobiales bacterium]